MGKNVPPGQRAHHRLRQLQRARGVGGQRDFFVQQFLDDRESIEAGHLYVEENQIGIVLSDQINRVKPIFTLSDNVNLSYVFQQIGKLVARKLFIVNYHR